MTMNRPKSRSAALAAAFGFAAGRSAQMPQRPPPTLPPASTKTGRDLRDRHQADV